MSGFSDIIGSFGNFRTAPKNECGNLERYRLDGVHREDDTDGITSPPVKTGNPQMK
ncbi:MAG: hypothetical protein LBT46_10090 [Planctomycetaceae bacterium]|jgi:hypothetical protein|nr:hypothetical protein [Planctomycetaceae bacterium]